MVESWTGEQIRVRLLPAIVRRQAARAGRFMAGGIMLYEIASGWQADILRRDAALHIASDAGELQDALRATGFGEIFIPVDAALTTSLIEKYCVAASREKTIYREVGHAGS